LNAADHCGEKDVLAPILGAHDVFLLCEQQLLLYEFLAAGILLSRCNLERAINGNRIGCVSNLIPPITKSSKMVYKQVVIIFLKTVSPKHTHPAMKASPPKGIPAGTIELSLTIIKGMVHSHSMARK